MPLHLRFSVFRTVVRFLNKVYLRLDEHDGVILSWTQEVLKIANTRGAVTAITYVKDARTAALRYLGGTPFKDNQGLSVALDESGLPPTLSPLLQGRVPSEVRLAMTLLGLSRIIPGWKSPDLTPITAPVSVKIPPTLGSELAGVVQELGWKITQPVWEECHVSTKAGPNAQAMISSIEDAHLLTDQQISDLSVCGGEELIRTMTVSRSLDTLTWLGKFRLKTRKGEITLAPKGILSRLSLVKDKEAKCRIVAILDYWTQSALYPLHTELMALLKSIRPDMTFNQGGFFSVLPKQGPYYSIDLSSATDRMPVEIQVPVLEALGLSKEYVASWRRLMTDRKFTYSFGPHSKGEVTYNAGQPMGGYSSWTAFSVTHHAIVRLAAKRAGLTTRFSSYVILGDDVVIANEAVAKEYRTIIASVGVSVSEAKTLVSMTTFEFAKRYVHNGVEVTGAPLGSFFEGVTWNKLTPAQRRGDEHVPVTKLIKRLSFYHVATWLKEVEARWLPRSSTMVSRGLLADFFKLFSLGQRLGDKAWRFFLLPSREDGRTLRLWKAEILGQTMLKGILGCASRGKAYERIVTLLAQSKAQVLESALKEQAMRLHDFQRKSVEWHSLFAEGVDAQSLLLSLPPFAVLRGNIAKLQLEMDKARRVRTSGYEPKWLHIDLQLFLDPFLAISARKSKIVAMNKVTILNYMSAMAQNIRILRDTAITDISLDGLKPLVANVFRGPKSGPGRSSNKGLAPQVIIRHDELTP